MSIAVVFPGQGSQYVGMGLEFLTGEDETWFQSVDQDLDFPLRRLLEEGPAKQLTQTHITQPAVFVVNQLLFRYVRRAGLRADYFAGHSLGEWNALVAAGWTGFEELLPVVVERGDAMHRAAQQVEGGMAAVLRLEGDRVKELCDTISQRDEIEGTVEIALLNSPQQIVVSGSRPALERLVQEARDAGALKAVSLDVSGPWHSQYMHSARTPLREALGVIDWQKGDIVVGNVTARPVDVETLEDELLDQLIRPVQWVETVQYLYDRGVRTFVEVGPGNVLTGLIQRICRQNSSSVDVYSTDTLAQTDETLKEVL